MLRDPLGTLTRIASEHKGAVVAIPLGPATAYLLTAPAQITHVLQEHWRRYPKGQGGIWVTVRRLVGESVVTADGDLWISHRRRLQSLFTARRLDEISETMIDTIDRSLSTLAERGRHNGPIALNHEMAMLTQNVVFATIFGAPLGRREADELGPAMVEALEQLGVRVFLYFLPPALPLPGELRFRRAVRRLDAAILGLLRARRAEGRAGHDLLSLLLEPRGGGEPLPDSLIRNELVTLFAGGYETTALTLTWALYLLAQHPQALAKLTAEVDEVLGKRRPTPADLPRLTYTGWVLKEALRLYPPGWVFTRNALANDVIDGYAVPAGATLLISPYVMHRDSALGERVDDFVPERFAAEPSWSPGRYIPFSAGPRLCIGDQFALLEGRLALAMFTQRFRWDLQPGQDVRPSAGVTLRPARQVQVYLHERPLS